MTDIGMIEVPSHIFSRIKPLSLVIDAKAGIRHASALIERICAQGDLKTQTLFDVANVLRPTGTTTPDALIAAAGGALRLRPRTPGALPLSGHLAQLEPDRFLLDLSFGIHLQEAVSRHGLTMSDFAPSDLAAEMLYLLEANTAVMNASRDLTHRLEQAKIRAEEQSTTDTLTGLKNRRALDRALSHWVEVGEPFALVHLDLDYFKQINDEHGHAVGDVVLQATANRMLAMIRDGDLAARVGGDEFVLVLRRVTDPATLIDLAQRLISEIEAPIHVAGTACHVSASVGVTSTTTYSALDIADMHKDADAALYASKNAGRARATLHKAS